MSSKACFQHSLTYYINGWLAMLCSTSLLEFRSLSCFIQYVTTMQAFEQKNKYNHAKLGKPFGRAELCHKGYVVGSSAACICSKGYMLVLAHGKSGVILFRPNRQPCSLVIGSLANG